MSARNWVIAENVCQQEANRKRLEKAREALRREEVERLEQSHENAPAHEQAVIQRQLKRF